MWKENKNFKCKAISAFNKRYLSFQLFPHFLLYNFHIDNINCVIQIEKHIYIYTQIYTNFTHPNKLMLTHVNHVANNALLLSTMLPIMHCFCCLYETFVKPSWYLHIENWGIDDTTSNLVACSLLSCFRSMISLLCNNIKCLK